MASSTSTSTSTSTSVSRMTSEESSWNTYIDYFLASQKKRTASYGSQDECSLSVGDASTLDAAHFSAASSSWKVEAPCAKKLKFKGKRRGLSKGDDELEDTATSAFSNQTVDNFDIWPTTRITNCGNGYINDGAAVGSRNNLDVKSDDVIRLSFAKDREESSGLRRKGLCLVPLHMLTDFLAQR